MTNEKKYENVIGHNPDKIFAIKNLSCASCGCEMNFNNNEDKWICDKCGHTSRGYI